MKVFVPPDFAKRAEKERIDDASLLQAVMRAEQGLVDAQLGAGLIKQRVPRTGRGRSGGFRTIIAYQRGALAVFLHMFAKNEKANLSKTETDEFRVFASHLADLDDEAFAQLVSERKWRPINDDQIGKTSPQ